MRTQTNNGLAKVALKNYLRIANCCRPTGKDWEPCGACCKRTGLFIWACTKLLFFSEDAQENTNVSSLVVDSLINTDECVGVCYRSKLTGETVTYRIPRVEFDSILHGEPGESYDSSMDH
jgi:hypothetical protein